MSSPRSFRSLCEFAAGVSFGQLGLLSVSVMLLAGVSRAAVITGTVVEEGSAAPVVGAMVSFRHGDPLHDLTVFTDTQGNYRSPDLAEDERYSLRVRRLGFQDAARPGLRPSPASELRRIDFRLKRESDPAALAAQLPANRWYALLLAEVSDDVQREELVRQCTFCHQQGNAATRRLRDEEEWRKILSLMARLGGGLSEPLRQQAPALFNRAYDPATAVPALTADMGDPAFAPPPDEAARLALIEEWELGHPASMQHDLVVHPDGRIYSVDMTQDKLYRLDPRGGNATRDVFDVPRGDLPLGGVFGGLNAPPIPNANAHVGPHSLQVAPDGALWTTLALGNQLARFDPVSETWQIYPLEEGLYPHTLRFDQRGRIWY
ncbi:MAG: carboxypeptidase regulatory-like domain-containing protein, partial [Myxococcota bacterium]